MNKLFLVLTIFLTISNTSDWKLLRNEEGIKLFTRNVAHSKIKEVKAETVFNAPLEDLETLFRDVAHYTKWFDECITSEQLRTIDDNTVYGRFVIQIPFPFQNRDVVAKLTFEKINTTTFQVITYNAPQYIPEKRRLIRVPSFKSIWTFTALENNTKTKTVMTLHANMGGNIPNWAINSATKWGPFLSIKKIRGLVE